MNAKLPKIIPLFNDIKTLIDSARQRAAVAVNAELTLLYWQVGQRIHTEVLKGERGEYGKEMVLNLAKQLTTHYGRGWSKRNLLYMVGFAQSYPDLEIVQTLSAQLSCTAPLRRHVNGWGIKLIDAVYFISTHVLRVVKC